MVDVLGRKYVLFDREQTEYLNKKRTEDNYKQNILDSATKLLDALDDYVQIYGSSIELDNNVREVVRRIEHVSGYEFYDDYENKSLEHLIENLKWE